MVVIRNDEDAPFCRKALLCADSLRKAEVLLGIRRAVLDEDGLFWHALRQREVPHRTGLGLYLVCTLAA